MINQDLMASPTHHGKKFPVFRSNTQPFGAHRVLEPQGVLPQAAQRIDASLPPYENDAKHRLGVLLTDDRTGLPTITIRFR